MTKSRFPLVRVGWARALEADGDWRFVEKLRHHQVRIHSVGFLLEEDSQWVLIAQSLTVSENIITQASGEIRIAREMIIEIEPLIPEDPLAK